MTSDEAIVSATQLLARARGIMDRYLTPDAKVIAAADVFNRIANTYVGLAELLTVREAGLTPLVGPHAVPEVAAHAHVGQRTVTT